MRKSRLGSSDMEFSVIGMGTWALGGADWAYGWGPQEDEMSIRTIHHALDLGINWIDTAAIYGLGHSEEIVGKALKSTSNKAYIATKCGRRWSRENKEIFGILKKDSVMEEVENSLRRLQIETIDLYQIHWPNPDEDLEEAWEAIHLCIKQGKIRHAGVSNFNMAQMRRLQSIGPITSLQPPYSMIKPGIEKDILPYCEKNNIGVICYSPMYKGMLTDKFTAQWAQSRPSTDHRSGAARFNEPELSVNLWFTGELKKLIQETGYTLAHLSLAWVLRRSEISCAIVGARSPEQIEETSKAGNWQLEPEIIKAIDELMIQRRNKIKDLP